MCQPFAEAQYNSTNLYDLLTVLVNNQIIEPINGQLQFKMICWMYYFAANRMVEDEAFANLMFSEKNAIYNADLIDFFTGITGRNAEAVNKITSSLENLSILVARHLGIDGDFNPFANIKWRLNETEQGVTQKQLEEKIQASRMPDEIKEVVADSSFDSVKPYTQQILNFR